MRRVAAVLAMVCGGWFGVTSDADAATPAAGSACAPLVAAFTDGGRGVVGGAIDFGGYNDPDFNAPPPPRLRAAVRAIATRSDGLGYWLTAGDGAVLAFGDARFFGSAGGLALAAPVVGIAARPNGDGYWLLGADGGVLSYGGAPFFGSAAGHLSAPAVAIAPTPTGRGYWVAAADGGVFAFGDAAFVGSAVGLPRAAPMVGMATTPKGDGYWLVGADGGVFSFGAAPFAGSAPGRGAALGIVATFGAPGYTVVGRDGSMVTFGSPPGAAPCGIAEVHDPMRTDETSGSVVAVAAAAPLRQCGAADVVLKTATDAMSYTASQPVMISSTMTNTTTLPCRLPSFCFARPTASISDANGNVVFHEPMALGLCVLRPDHDDPSYYVRAGQMARTYAYSWNQHYEVTNCTTGCPSGNVPRGRYTVIVSWPLREGVKAATANITLT